MKKKKMFPCESVINYNTNHVYNKFHYTFDHNIQKKKKKMIAIYRRPLNTIVNMSYPFKNWNFFITAAIPLGSKV